MTHQRPGILLSRLACQLKSGCEKPICFNDHCAKNKALKLSFSSDSQVLREACRVLHSADDASELICAEPTMLSDSNKRRVPYQTMLYLKNVCPMFVFQSLEWFACSFVQADTEAGIDIKQLKRFYSVVETLSSNFKQHVSEMCSLIQF